MIRKNFEFKNVKTIGISGHTKPDGDCTGSCLALKGYLEGLADETEIETVDVYLEPIADSFKFLKGSGEIKDSYEENKVYDLFITLDCASLDRLGEAEKHFNLAKKTINIDHHISNTNFADMNHVVGHASSACEVLYELFDYDKINKNIAEALYLGIAHDTGVFKHSNTSRKTMEIAGLLMEKGVNFSKIIDKTFYRKTHNQIQILGRALVESTTSLDGKVIISIINQGDIGFYQLTTADLDGIIDQLRITKGVEVAIFIYEISKKSYKISMRSNNHIDVSKIAVEFEGGGHIKAAGCTMNGSLPKIIEKLKKSIEKQLIE